MKKILFVCSGNTCRSPMAEGIAKVVFSPDFSGRVSSAGSSALDGLPASSLAIEVARKNNIDLSAHRSRLLSGTLVREADLIVTMGSNHRETVGIIEPAALAYTYLFTDFCGEVDGDVPDPIGLSTEAYQRTYDLIEKCVKEIAGKLETFEGWKRPDTE